MIFTKKLNIEKLKKQVNQLRFQNNRDSTDCLLYAASILGRPYTIRQGLCITIALRAA